MNTEKLYIASLRVATKRTLIRVGEHIVTHKHLKYVLVKSNKEMEVFKDLKTRQKYKTSFLCSDVAIDLAEAKTFNEVTGNTQNHMTKRKALNLFDKTADRWRIVE